MSSGFWSAIHHQHGNKPLADDEAELHLSTFPSLTMSSNSFTYPPQAMSFHAAHAPQQPNLQVSSWDPWTSSSEQIPAAVYPPAVQNDLIPAYYHQSNPSLSYQPISYSPGITPQNGSSIQNPGKRNKKGRAIQACEHCRLRKQRCNEGSPCAFCREFGLECTYRQAVHPRVDKTDDLVLSWMVAHAEALQLLAAKMDHISRPSVTTEEHGDIDPIAPRLKLLWPLDSNQPMATSPLEHESSNGSPPSSVSTAGAVAALPRVLKWPKVHELFAGCGIAFDEDYLIAAEERPASQFMTEFKSDPDHDHVERLDLEQTAVPSRTPRLDDRTIKTLYLGFVRHMLPLQPFIPHKQIKPLLGNFVRSYSESQSGGTADCDKRCVDRVETLKRKHEDLVSERAPKRVKVECSPNNAIIFLVLALGETTLEKEPRLSADDSVPAGAGDDARKDYPGVAYYTKAMGLMSCHLDGDDLVHAQMFLLAGLYKAQLGRIQEASSWYFMAGRVLLRLLDRHRLTAQQDFSSRRSSSAKPRNEDERFADSLTAREHLIVLAAWTCLRLESEIIPELRYPLSGLERIRNDLPLPEQLFMESLGDDRYSPLENTSHIASLEAARLRSLTSYAEEQILSGCSANVWPEQLRVVMKSHTAAIHEWRMSLPESLRWNDQDAPPNCSVIASFRRSYWEAKLALLKPFLYYALHILPDLRLKNTTCLPREVDRDHGAGYNPHILAAIHVTMKKSGESEILRLAELCIEAAKCSIVAYEGIMGRPVLTNVPDITHSLFTNVLLLAAAHRDISLRRSVSASELRRLMDQTIEFMQRFASLSPTCRADCSLLRQFRQTLFHEAEPRLH